MIISKIRKSFLFSKGDEDGVVKNKSRIFSYDIMRGLAVVLMIMIHVVHVYAKNYNEDSVIGYIVEFLGGPPAAPTFMMLMGIFFIYSNKGTTRMSISRGFKILLIAFILNLVRGVVPYFILTELQGFSVESLGEYFRMEFLLFEVDILTFAGISYMLMAIIYHYFKKPIVWLAIAVAIAVGSPFLWSIDVKSLPLQYITNVFWGDEYLSVFPVFPWIVFPLVGMVVGRLLLVSKDYYRTINKLGLSSIFFIIIGVRLIFLNSDYFFNAYGKMGIGAIIAIIGFVLLWQLLITKIHNLIGGKINTGFLMFLSKYVLQVYFIHWVLCKWAIVIFGKDSMGIGETIFMFIAVTALTMLISMGYTKLNMKQKNEILS